MQTPCVSCDARGSAPRLDINQMTKHTERPTPEEIVVIHRSENERPDTAGKIERLAKILSLIAIPIVIAAIGWMIQDVLSQRAVSKDYVQLAVTILTKEPENVDHAIREWAVDLLNDNSPTKFSADVTKRLKAGEISLPEALSAVLSTAGAGGTLAISPDGRNVATAHKDGTIRVWEWGTGESIGILKEHKDAVTSIAFSPDGQRLISGSMDTTVCMWDVSKMHIVAKFMAHKDGVIGVGISPDGRTAITRSLDGTLVYWDPVTGQMLRRVRLGP